MAYAYQQTLFDGVKEGYVQYNIEPAFGTPLSLGQTFTITGKMYSRDEKRIGIKAYLGFSLNASGFPTKRHEVGYTAKACSKGGSTTFTLTGTITQAVINRAASEGLSRSFQPYLTFSLMDSETGGAGTIAVEAQKPTCLQSRLAPVINSVTFADATGGLTRFGGMVQNESSITCGMSITTDPLDTSVEITTRTLVVGGKSFSLTSDLQNIGKLNMTGSKTWTLTVTDNQGNSATSTGTLTFLAYASPTLAAIGDTDVVQRYEARTDDEGHTTYVVADDGAKVWFTFAATIAAVAGSNAWTLKCAYREYDASTSTTVTFLSGTDGQSLTRQQERSFLDTVTFSQSNRYSFVLTLQDFYHTVSLEFDIDKAGGYAFIGKHAVAVGMRGTGTVNDKRFEVAEEYTSHFYGDAIFHGGIISSEEYAPEMLTGTATPGTQGGELAFHRVGPMVFLSGTAKLTTAAREAELCDVPESFMPADMMSWITAVASNRIACLSIGRRTDDTGVLKLEWVRATNSSSNVSAAFDWIDVSKTYWAG